jgi:hypothetical protein
VNIGLDRLTMQIIAPNQLPVWTRMPRCGSHRETVREQMPNDAAAKKTGSTEHGDGSDTHFLSPGQTRVAQRRAPPGQVSAE